MLHKRYLLIETLRSLSELQDRVLNTIESSDLDEYHAIKLQEAWARVVGCAELLENFEVNISASDVQIDSAIASIVEKMVKIPPSEKDIV